MRDSIHRIVLTAVCLTIGCGTEMPKRSSELSLPVLASVTAAEWTRLASRRLVFAHQSVGGNVLEGVTEVLRAHPEIPIRVVEVTGPADVQGPALYHKKIGVNGKPATKLAEFDSLTTAAFADSAASGVAMLKFCYVDVKGGTDPVALFEDYRREVEALRASRPGVVIVHVTMPLWVDTGLIDHVGTIVLGKATPIRALNAARHRYNELLRATYGGHEPLFDLAAYEALRADGSVADVRYRGARVPSLAHEWTTDGGHLNPEARRRLAEAFLVTLAGIP